MTWDHRYRMLAKGEVIQEGDEVDASDGEPKWEPATAIGKIAPDPLYTSHRRYRRLSDHEPKKDKGKVND